MPSSALKLSDPKYDFSDSWSGTGDEDVIPQNRLDLRGDALIVFVILLK